MNRRTSTTLARVTTKAIISKPTNMKNTILLLIALATFACADRDDWQNGMFCTCEITLDKDPDFITFFMKGCQYCCWTMTVPVEDCRVSDGREYSETNPHRLNYEEINRLGEKFFNQTNEEDPVCEWEDVDWEWGFGQPLN